LLELTDIFEVDPRFVVKCYYLERRCDFPFSFRKESVQEKAPAREGYYHFKPSHHLLFVCLRSLLAQRILSDAVF